MPPHVILHLVPDKLMDKLPDKLQLNSKCYKAKLCPFTGNRKKLPLALLTFTILILSKNEIDFSTYRNFC